MDAAVAFRTLPASASDQPTSKVEAAREVWSRTSIFCPFSSFPVQNSLPCASAVAPKGCEDSLRAQILFRRRKI